MPGLKNQTTNYNQPQIEVFYDEHDKRAQDYWDDFEKDRNKNLESLHKAATEILKSANPDGKQIYQLFEGMYLTEKGKKEKDNKRSCRFLIKAISLFDKNKASKDIANKTRLLFYKRKLEVLKFEKKPLSETFKKMANTQKSLGKNKDYHAEMSLFCLNKSIESMHDLPKAKVFLQEGTEYAKKSGNKDILNKMNGLLHRINSYDSKTLEGAISEIEKEILAIERTSDRYGIDVAMGDLNFLKSKMISAPDTRAKLLEEAAEYYEKAGMSNRAHQIRGNAFQIMGNNTNPADYKHADFYQKSADEYEKAGNKRMQKWMEGHRQIALASIDGVIAGDDKAFRFHLMSANHKYRDAGNIGGLQYTAGVGIFLDALRAEYPQSISLFNSAAECLESVKENYLSSFARAEIARIKAFKSKTKSDQKIFLLEEKNALERAALEEKKGNLDQSIEIVIGGSKVSAVVLGHLNTARIEELNAFLENDREIAKIHFGRAKVSYLAIKDSEAFKISILSGLGWCNLFLENILEAKDYFEKLKKISPHSEHVELGEQALNDLIKLKYSQQVGDDLIKKRLSLPLQISLIDDVVLVSQSSGRPYPSDFFNICLAITKRSCNQLERYRKDFCKLNEEALRNQILIISNSIAEEGLGATITGETFSGEGKSDIFAKNSQEQNDFFLGECKVWKSQSEYKAGFDQLIERYQTATDRAGVLINFVKVGKLTDNLIKAKSAVLELDQNATITDIEGENAFVSQHKEFGIIFHKLVDLVSYKNKKIIRKK